MKINFNLKIKLKKWYASLPSWSKHVIDFVRFVVEYGVLLSIVACGLFGAAFNILLFFGLGILYYFIVYEVPVIYKNWKRWRE